MVKTVSPEEVKSRLEQILSEVQEKGTSFTVSVGGKEVARIVPPTLSWEELYRIGERTAAELGLTEEKVAEVVMEDRYGKGAGSR